MMDKEQQAMFLLRNHRKEQRGIYNVTYNAKFSTPIKKDLDTLNEALRYARGNKNKGATHIVIKHQTDKKQEGYITQQELLNLGTRIREYLTKHQEPFIDIDGARIYEWENDEGNKFRLVVNDILTKKEASGSGTSPQLPRPPADDIITYYSDRNLPHNKTFEFKNPKLHNKEKELQGINPLPFSSRAQEAEAAKSLSSELSAHANNSPIANFDKNNSTKESNQSQSTQSKPKIRRQR